MTERIDAPTSSRLGYTVLIMAMLAMMFMFCTVTLFNTKGEPREALVAVAMLQSGDWILPSCFGGAEMPYKPPVLAWCIAVVSWFCGGQVTELTSRLPSLIAAIILVLATARFFSQNSDRGWQFGWMTGWITLTSFEVFRAATACRVDMLLTAMMVGAMYGLYGWFRRGCRHLMPWGAILLMSGAFLTKGPVGMGLPCLVIWIYRLFQGDRPAILTLRMAGAACLSIIIPGLWYAAAYARGGSEFFDLVIEENIGRLTGTMSYESHVNPAYYNIISIIAGMVPYTLLALMALVAVRWHRVMESLSGLRSRIGNMSPVSAFAVTAAITIFVFYCIPKSKRSVYLLPMYPFMAWGVTLLLQWLSLSLTGRRVVRGFTAIIAISAVITPISWVVIRAGLCGDIGSLTEFSQFQPLWITLICIIVCLISLAAGGYAIARIRRPDYICKPGEQFSMYIPMVLSIFGTYMVLDNAILPPLLSAKSDLDLALRIKEINKSDYYLSWVDTPMLHFYTVNFYLDDHDRPIDPEQFVACDLEGALILTNESDISALIDTLGTRLDGFELKPIWTASAKSCDTRKIPVVLRITRK